MLNRVTPKGFLRHFLEKQMNGLTGHMEEAGFPYDVIQWGKAVEIPEDGNPQWWVYEQTAYHVDGLVRAAILLDDKTALKKAEEIIYGVLDDPDEDGYLGPYFMKQTDGMNRWSHVVFFRACMALYDYNGDEKIVTAMTKHYLGCKTDFSAYRDVLNVEIMLWLYGKTKEKALLDLAVSSYEAYNAQDVDQLRDKVALSRKKPYAHGVSYCEYSKLGAILYSYTGEQRYLKASVAAFKKADQFFMLPGGCVCSNEFLINDDYMQSYETCDISDYTWSLAYLLRITKNADYGDKIEKCVFNAGLGSVTEDFKALQYFSCANQFIADDFSNHNLFFRGAKWMRYAPNPGTACCAGNVNRFMPNYVLNMWHCEADKVYSLLFGASKAEFTIAGARVTISQTKDYPFEESLHYVVETETPFTLYVRKPKWTNGYRVNVEEYAEENGFLAIRIAKNCEIDVTFESKIEERRSGDGTYLEKGVFVYSYPIETRLVAVEEDGKTFPAYRMYPAGEWRYCLTDGDWEFAEGSACGKYDLGSLPRLTVSVKKVENWDLKRAKKIKRCTNLYSRHVEIATGKFTFTPRLKRTADVKTTGPATRITLLPYGFTKLRLTVFNKVTANKSVR